MFFSTSHEDYFVDPVIRHLGFSYAAHSWSALVDDVATKVQDIIDSNGKYGVVNINRKTAIRVWERLDGDLYNAGYLAYCAAQTAATDKSPSAISAQPESTEIMNTSKATQTVNYVYGRDVTTMSTQDLINAAVRVKGEIKALADTDVRSTKIESMIADLQTSLATITTALDAS